jgi:group I intron endonuclease
MTKSKKERKEYQEMGHVYIVTNKKNGKGYIGQTIRSIHRRLGEHQLESSKCRAFAGAIKKHGWSTFHIEWYECPVDELNKHEKWLIQLMGTLAPYGYNLTEGGANGRPSEETRQKMSEALSGENNPMWGKHHNEETIQKQSEAMSGEKNPMFGKIGEKNPNFGSKRSEETKQKIGDSMSGEKNHMSKRVYQYDLDDTFISSFESADEAARYIKKPDGGSAIRACARGERKTAYKFKWSNDNHICHYSNLTSL